MRQSTGGITGRRGLRIRDLVLAIACAVLLSLSHPAEAGGGGNGGGDGGGGDNEPGVEFEGAFAKAEQARAAAGSVAGISAPEVAVANIPATATRLSVPETVAETDRDCTGLACDPWLQEEHKKALVALLRDYYTVGLGVGGGGPEQAEIVSVLAAKLITYTR